MLINLPIAKAKMVESSIKFSMLGEYQLNFKNISSVATISGHNLLATVSEKPGANFSMFLPFSVQQINYLVSNGSYVEKDQMVAYLNGFDLHHFLDEFTAAEQLFKNAEQQYLSSKKLFDNKALQQSQWLTISQNYFAAQLRYEHLNHYKVFLNIDESGNIAITSPISGYVRFSSEMAVKQEGEILFDIIPKNSIRLKASVPIINIKNLQNFNVVTTQCQLGIDSSERVIKNFSQITWSSPLNNECLFTLGEQVLITPHYQQNAFEIIKEAVFEFNNKDYIAIKQSTNELKLIVIDILGASGDSYYFLSNNDLTNQKALVSSVSALQGVLLELGSE